MKISQAEARSITLANQGLGHGGRFADASAAMRALVAVQTQYPASLAPALAARAENVTSAAVERLLSKEKRFLKGWSLRSTLHTALAEDHMLLLGMIGPQVVAGHARWMAWRGIEREQLTELHSQIMDALAGGPLGRRELHERVPFYKGVFMVGWGLDAMGLSAEGKVVLSKQAAAKTEFVRLDIWSPEVEPWGRSRDEAAKELARRYFAGYGPATFADFKYWAGLRVTNVAAALREVREELTPVEIEGFRDIHYLYGSAAPAKKAAVRLLPKFDPLMMGRRDKSLVLPDKVRDRVFRPAGQVEAVVLADGQVRGTWRTVRKGKVLQFTVEPFAKLNEAAMAGLPREALRVAKALGFSEAVVSVV